MDLTPSTDAHLLRRYALNGDERAFTELVQRHLGLIYRVALRKSGNNRALAEDVAQRVFILLARKAETLAGHKTIIGWLHQTACFVTSEFIRTECRRIAREQKTFAMEQIDQENPSPETNHDWTTIAPVIDESLAELTDHDREIVLLRYFANLPHAEVGRKLAISENAARMRLDRALSKLQGALQRRGIASTAAALSLTLTSQMNAASAAIPAAFISSISAAALAGGTGLTLAGANAGFLASMTTAKATVLTVSTLAVFSLGLSLSTTIQKRSADERLNGELAREQSLKHELASIQSNLKKENIDLSRASDSSLPTTANVAETTTKAEINASIARLKKAIAARQERLASDPDYQRKWNEAVVADLNVEYRPFYRTNDLTDEKSARFEEILRRKAWDKNDLYASARSLNISSEDPAVQSELKRQESTYTAELQSLLSESEFASLQQFDLTAIPRRLVTAVAAHTYYTSTPLTAEQGTSLVLLIAANDPHLTGVGPAWRQDGFNWDAIFKGAKPLLSPKQMEVLAALAATQKWAGEQIRIGNGWEKP
jgi:RNA polymerase sigma factor (sigma-70 family)